MKTTALEVLYEDRVLKPLGPVEGLSEHERAWVLICSKPMHQALPRLRGVLASDDAKIMRDVIALEFEKIEGEW